MTKQFKNKHYFVPQKRPDSGCIPWGYEIILRAANVPGINFQTFQDDFDFDKYHQHGESGMNNFDTVSKAIMKRYPHVVLGTKIFSRGQGEDKLQFVEKYIGEIPRILVSICPEPDLNPKAFHIMPVLSSTNDSLVLLYSVKKANDAWQLDMLHMSKAEFVHKHDVGTDGCDVAFLDM